jgi:hypothetical protein
MTYLNIKTAQGVETVDQLERKDFATYKDYCTELKRLKNEYRVTSSCYASIYTSQRSTNEWKQ